MWSKTRALYFPMRRILLLCFVVASSLVAQSSPQRLRVVMPAGPGSVAVNLTDGWMMESFNLYIDGVRGSSPIYRPVLLAYNAESKIRASYILFANDTKAPTAEGCREANRGTIEAAKKFSKEHGETVSEIKESFYTTPSAKTLPISSHMTDGKLPNTLHQFDMHVFLGDTANCAILHLSKDQYQPGDEKLFGPLIDGFINSYERDYVATASDYSTLGKLLSDRKLPRLAAAYIDSAVAEGGSGVNPAAPLARTQPLEFALASHPGYLKLDLPSFAVTELSAKPNGKEFGIRARDKSTGMTELGFLYLPAAKAPLTAASCMQSQMESELKAIQDQASYRNLKGKRVVKSPSGLEVGIVEYEPTRKMPRRFGYSTRLFVAANDVCADLSFDSESPIAPDTIESLVRAIEFDANRTPDFFGKFRYAMVLYDHRNYAAAGPVYESALSLVSTVDNATKWRRVATDQASMAYGIAGDLKRSRAINEAAIGQDPGYPLYYYNLACADAEAGDAVTARKHLQEAFDRRENVLQGEALPDPAKDDSILKLKNDREFWKFVQGIGKG